MNLKGLVSSVDVANRTARVTFRDRDNVVTPEIRYAAHITVLEVGDTVAVAFFSSNLSDGIIFAVY